MKLSNQPLVSIIIPCYNCANFVEQTIDSALNQTYPNLEIIVVNDGSTDHSLEIIEKYKNKIKIITQNNQGAAGSRNAGILSAKGEYISFIDGDDILSPRAIEFKMNVFAQDQKIGLVIGRFYAFNEKGLIPGYETTENVATAKNQFYSCLSDGVGACGPIYRREVFINCGLYNPFLKTAEDPELYTRLTIKYRIGFDYHICSYYRRFKRDTLSSNMIRNYVETLKSFILLSIIAPSRFEFAIRVQKRLITVMAYKTLSYFLKIPFVEAMKGFIKLTCIYPLFLIHALLALPCYVWVKINKFLNRKKPKLEIIPDADHILVEKAIALASYPS